MREYTVIKVPNDLLPQIVGELLQFALDANDVDVVHEGTGRVVHAHPAVAAAWFEARRQKDEAVEEPPAPPVEEPIPEPVVPPPPPPAPVAPPAPPAPTPPPAPEPPVARKKAAPPASNPSA